MGSNVSIAEALAQLESKIAYHKEQREVHAAQEAHHAGQQAFHAEQKKIHETGHREAVERYEAFKAASESIGGTLVDVKPPAPAPGPAPLSKDVSTGGWRWLQPIDEPRDRVQGTRRGLRRLDAHRRDPQALGYEAEARHRAAERLGRPPPLGRHRPDPPRPRRPLLITSRCTRGSPADTLSRRPIRSVKTTMIYTHVLNRGRPGSAESARPL